MSGRIHNLKQAISLSEQILVEIEGRHWQRVEELEKQRDPLMTTYFSAGQPLNVGLVQKLKDINDLIVQRLIDQREATRKNRLDQHRRSHASKAYLDNANR